MKNYRFSKLAVAMGLISLPLTAVQAQESSAEETANVERISVTGSRLQRTEAESAAPVQVFTAEDIEATGLTSMELILQQMSASAGFGGNPTSTYWVGGGWGTAQVNLRGLGVSRTLVLLNGRRIVNGGSGANASVDLNIIPTSIIERVEVLKDGASAIYGADAVAGVVNIITKKDYDGFMIEGRMAGTEHGDGEERQVNMMLGASSDRGRVVTTLSYRDTEAVNMADRTPCPLVERTPGELSCSPSGSTPGGRAVISSGPNAGQIINFNQDPDGDPSSYAPYDPEVHGSNSFPYLNAVNPVSTFSFSTFGDYRVKGDTYAFAEVLYNQRQSSQTGSPNTLRNISYSAAHPNNPVGEDINVIMRRLDEGGGRDFDQEVNTWRFVTGLQGVYGDGWNWEFSYNYGRNTGRDGADNIVNLQRLDQVLTPSECGGDIPCSSLLGINSMSQEALDYILFRIDDNGGNEQRTLSFNVNGDLTENRHGYVPVAFGIEHRKERGWNEPDSSVVAGVMNTNQQEPLSGQYSVTEAYVETSIPLLSGMQFAEFVSLDLAYRYSDYDLFGSDGNYKVGLHWNVNDNLKLRSTVSTAFRVPSIPELFSGVGEGNLTTSDPCSGWDQPSTDSVVAANCQADGVPEGFQQQGSNILTQTGGNINLQPEDADTFTAGLVWDVDWVENLQVTLDYFSIEMSNAIRSVAGSTKLSACYNSEGKSHQFCSSDTFTRDPLTGEINFLSAQPDNVANEKISGWDASVFYATTLLGMDTRFNWNLTYLDEYSIQPYEGAPMIEYAGKLTGGSGSYARVRSDVNATVISDNWRFNYTIRMIGSANDINASPGDIGASVSDVFYHDVQGTYYLDDNWTIQAGVNNLLDKSAPYVRSWTDANTDTMTYDLMGRQLYMKLRYEF